MRNFLTVITLCAGCGASGEVEEVSTSAVILGPSEALELSVSASEVEVLTEPQTGISSVVAVEAPYSDLEEIEITVLPGENLSLYAQWTNVSVETISERNGLDVTDNLHPGQRLFLETTEDKLEESREVFVDGRLFRYIDRRGGLAGINSHRVRTGDTAWRISNEVAGVPPWVFAHYNSDVPLDQLRIGQELIIPVFSDTLADNSIPLLED